ncbi:MAG: hypothetical protein AB7G11_14500 [Phycisphaerales bacterium]
MKAIIGLVTVLIAATIGGCAATESEPADAPTLAEATVDEPWDSVFTRASCWNGGDIAHSIDLRDGRTLWLFGDSIFGPVIGGSRVGERSRMMRAGVAWHPTPERGAAPAWESVQFAGPEEFEGLAAAAWTSPAPGLFPEGTWYWLMNDGVRITRPQDRLVLFATAIGPSGNPDGMWNFRRVGGAVITVQNPAAPPDQWRSVQRVNPRVSAAPLHGEPVREGENDALAIVPWPDESGEYAVFGAHTDRDGTQRLTVARADGDDLAQPERWRREGLVVLGSDVPRVPDEFTVQRVRWEGRDVLVMIYSEPFLNRSIWARTALDPRGPWSIAKAVYDTPDWGKGTFAYAAKGHAGLSRPGELLVTYAVNGDFGDVFERAVLYRPKFVRVPLSVLPGPPPGPRADYTEATPR